MPIGEIGRLITIISRLPGMGNRSANRIVVHLLKKRNTVLESLIRSLSSVHADAKVCQICNNIDISSPCSICLDHKRDSDTLCVISDISDLWSIERAGGYRGKYHVLGGKLSAVEGIRPCDLNIDTLSNRIEKEAIKEVIIAMSADLDGQTTMFFIHDIVKSFGIKITTLAHGVPVGGELDYLDDGTIITAFNQRREI